ncbi:hypothetical protein Dsin_009278 [Dipteronia sinensis]|uniref:DNA-directed RNA polymerase n=1 Tax=Dipteronia sinensis TaxID=43782 RepID=A0AAE0AQB1_9ROSI|nr:hypothetical protein Dsin_009278 [Dipteronia sinensis]
MKLLSRPELKALDDDEEEDDKQPLDKGQVSKDAMEDEEDVGRSEKCIVGTGLERQVALDSGVTAIAVHEGKVLYTDIHKIVLSGNRDTIGISLVMCQCSNKNTCMNQKPQVRRDRCIKKGQVLADGAATVGGELALGKNVLVAYMPWEGYNFEDAVLISERLIYRDIYTSFHIRKYEIQTHVTSQGPERITNEIPHLEVRLLRNLDKNGIVMLGSWVETGDILVGVPSRMNVGEIFECSLGLAGGLLNIHYRITPFDERYELEASRKLMFSELYEASKQTTNPWVFELEYPGKRRIFDRRTEDPFEQPVIIGKPYILKLIHQVDDKIDGCSSGGSPKQGGQRVGEMEVWALKGFGVAHILQEMLTYKSNYIRARQEVLGTTIIGGTIPTPEDAPESFRFLVQELRSLALELNHFFVSEKNFQINKKEASY